MNEINPMASAHAAPRCSARSKRTGKSCGAPAMTGWAVCYHHGARGGAPHGPAHGRFVHGGFTIEAVAVRRQLADLIREAKGIDDGRGISSNQTTSKL
jgi:hypothetical protein